MNVQHNTPTANALPLFAWAEQDRRQRHPDPLHILRLRGRFGLTRRRAMLIADLAGIGPREAR